MDKYNHKKMLPNQSRLAFFAFKLFFLLFFSSTIFAQTAAASLQPRITPKLNLTVNEQIWLTAHPTIILGLGVYPPMNFIDEHGNSVGIAPDLLNIVAQRLGINFNLVSGNWAETQALAKDHQIDGIGLLLKTTARKKYLDFAGPYTQFQYAIVVHKQDQSISTLDDLANKRVAGIEGSYAQYFLKKNHPEINLVLYNSYEELINALINREVQAVVENLPSLIYFIDKHLITGLKVAGFPDTMDSDLYTGIRKDWPQFTSILNKAFASISAKDRQNIVNKWTELYPTMKKSKQLPLTLQQKKWLAEQHKVRVRVIDYPPYMIIHPGKPPEGIAIDYLKLIAQRTGIKFSYEITDQPFYKFLESMKKKQDFDLGALVVNRRDRREYMRFSHNYIESTPVLFARNDSPFIGSIQGLFGRSVAVEKGGNAHRLLAIKYPQIKLHPYDSGELALTALANGSVDGYVGSLSNSAYIIQEHGFSNIHVIAPSSLGSEYYAMANRKDWPELTSIINTALASISEKEKIAIQQKYVVLKYDMQRANLKKVLVWSFLGICLALLLVLFFVIWNRSLCKLVDRRTSELQDEVAVRKKEQKALLKSQKEAQKTQKIACLGSWEWILKTDKITWSRELYRIFDFPIDTKLTFKTIMAAVHPDDQQAVKENHARWLNFHDGSKYEFRIIKPDGSLCYAYSMVEIECNDQGEVIGLFGTMQDISERKENERLLLHYQQRLKSLVLQLTLAEDQERRRIAAELHDNVGQSLALTRLQLATVLKRLPEDNKAVDLVRNSSQSLLIAIQETRHLIFELSSPSLNELGLAAAITQWRVKYCEPSFNLEVEIIDHLKQGVINLDLRAILFRNIRELLVNVIKHAKASEVVITLEEKSGNYIITVKDNGIGFLMEKETESLSAKGHFGLFSIDERLTDLGGKLSINSTPNEGCTVVMELPTAEMDNVINAK